MAKIVGHAECDLIMTFTVTEQEARALDALAGYGDDAFIKAFYEKLGKAYMQNHEEGLRSFLRSIRALVGPVLARQDMARKAFTGRYRLEEIDPPNPRM